MQIKQMSTKDGWTDWLLKNPILFAIVIFPTLTMGALVMVKPNLREQVYDLLGWGDDSGVSSAIGRSTPSIKDTPAAAYEGDGSLKKEEEREIIQAIVSEGGTTSATNIEEDTAAAENSVSAPAAGERNIRVEIDGNENEATVDLIHSIGIRPHSSS